jgi:RecA/RadA recombinase
MGFASAEGFTVRVLRCGGSGAAGIGFMIGDGRIVTCAHVVNVALGREKEDRTDPDPASLITIDFPLVNVGKFTVPEMRKCKIAVWQPPSSGGDPGLDIAGLELINGVLPGKAGLARVFDPTDIRNTPVQVFGYPVIPKDPRPDGVWARLRLVGGVGSGRVQLDDEGDAAYRAEPGFSGSPVVARDAVGDLVVGVFAMASKSKQSKDSYAIAASAVLEVWPEALSPVTASGPTWWATGYGAPTSYAAGRAPYGILPPQVPPLATKPVHELPSAPPALVGRADESNRLMEWLGSGTGNRLVNIYGISGSGKTALALHVAHEKAGQHPDCQLYFNVRASDQSPVSAEELLDQKLRSLGVPPSEVPSGLQARAEEYRSRLWGRRPLVVIENATTAEQVRPLLPNMRDATVIITSWTRITKIPGLKSFRLQPLDDDSAADLLALAADRPVGAAERKIVRQIARFLGNLPLALQVAGGVLQEEEHWTWQMLYDRLRAEAATPGARPVVLGSGEVQASFELAYGRLDRATALGYRLLGLAPAARMSQGLVQALISEYPAASEGIIDQLVKHQLLQPESAPDDPLPAEARVFRMHDLLWRLARTRIEEEDSQETRDAAVRRMTQWSLIQLSTRYLDHLKSSLVTLPSVVDHRKHMSLPDTYIDSTVTSADSRHTIPADTLSGLFPDRCHHLLLMAPGGTGKTTMAGHLCLRAAASNRGAGASRNAAIPVILLIRDITPGTEDISLESLIIRTLRYRYETDVTPDALSVTLKNGSLFVIADGLDEVMPDLRQRATTSINEFADRYPLVPVLVTTRPFAAAQQVFPTFTVATIAPWTPRQAKAYLDKLTHASEREPGNLHALTRRLAGRHGLGLVGTPLGIQMLLGFYWQSGGLIPDTFTALVEGILQLLLGSREVARGITWQGDPGDVRDGLERVAFAMQSNPDNRITVTEQEIKSILEISQSGDRYSRLHYVTSDRYGVMAEIRTSEDGQRLYAFTHTAFREHLAASRLVRMHLNEVDSVMRENHADPSWQAVFVVAFELAGRTWLNPGASSREPSPREAMRSWAQYFGVL